MMKSRLQHTIIAMALCLPHISATAWFEYQDDSQGPVLQARPQPIAQATGDCPAGVQHIGQKTPYAARGFGRGVPLPVALEMIAPPGWRLQLHETDSQTTLSWRAGQDWLTPLAAVAPTHCVQLNWRTRSLRVRARDPGASRRQDQAQTSHRGDANARLASVDSRQNRAQTSQQPAPPSSSPDVDSEQNQTQTTSSVWQPQAAQGVDSKQDQAQATGSEHSDSGPEATVRGPEATVRVWTLQDGQGLREILGEWSKRSGWQLVWDAHSDYRIEARSSYVGDYRQAVRRVLEDLAQSGLPLGAEFYTGNRVLRVRQVR